MSIFIFINQQDDMIAFSLQGHGDDDEPEESALPAESTAAAGSTGGYVADMEPPVPLPEAPVEAEDSEEDMGNVSWRVFIYAPED